jgi:Ecdysteroid kinase-like family
MGPDEIDANWLNDALAERHPGVRVADVEIVRVDELTNTHVRLRLSYDEPAGAPAHMFCKLPPLDPARREALAGTNMGPRESRFYAELAPALTMRVPTMHAARYDDRDRSFVQLLEDLDAAGCTVPDGTRGVTPDAAARALEDLADLHLQF